MHLEELHLEKLPCDYADVRVEERYRSNLVYRNFETQSGIELQDTSAFIRVFHNGRWFFSTTTDIEKIGREIDRLMKLSGRFPGISSPLTVPHATRRNIIRCADENARLHPLREKKRVLESYFFIYRKEKKLADCTAIYADWWIRKHIRSSKGHQCTYDTTMHGLHFDFTVKDGGQMFRSRFGVAYPVFLRLSGLQNLVSRDLAEAKRFLRAKTVKPGTYPVILSEQTAGVFAHESFGHKSEADFMMGDRKMMEEWQIGKRVGASTLSIVDRGNVWGTCGYCPFDDEGTMCRKTYLIRNGILEGRLHSLETATALGEKPTGNARAINGQFEPMVRMTNTYIEAGASRFNELLEGIELGVYVKSFRHGSGLSTFTIAPDRAYMIRDGRLAEPVRVAVVSGTVFQTLKDIDGLSSRVRLFRSVIGGCGKSEQAPLPVSFGGPKVKVRQMHVS